MPKFGEPFDERGNLIIVEQPKRALPALLLNREEVIDIALSGFTEDELEVFSQDKRRVYRAKEIAGCEPQLVIKGEDRIRAVGNSLVGLINGSIVPDMEEAQGRLPRRTERLHRCIETQQYGVGAEKAELVMERLQELDALQQRGARATAIVSRIHAVFPLAPSPQA